MAGWVSLLFGQQTAIDAYSSALPSSDLPAQTHWITNPATQGLLDQRWPSNLLCDGKSFHLTGPTNPRQCSAARSRLRHVTALQRCKYLLVDTLVPNVNPHPLEVLVQTPPRQP